jgi:hypothetical protein
MLAILAIICGLVLLGLFVRAFLKLLFLGLVSLPILFWFLQYVATHHSHLTNLPN